MNCEDQVVALARNALTDEELVLFCAEEDKSFTVPPLAQTRCGQKRIFRSEVYRFQQESG